MALRKEVMTKKEIAERECAYNFAQPIDKDKFDDDWMFKGDNTKTY